MDLGRQAARRMLRLRRIKLRVALLDLPDM